MVVESETGWTCSFVHWSRPSPQRAKHSPQDGGGGVLFGRVMFLKKSLIKFKKREILLKNLISTFSSEMGRSSITHVLTWRQLAGGGGHCSCRQAHALQFTAFPAVSYCQPSPPAYCHHPGGPRGHLHLWPLVSMLELSLRTPLLVTPSAFLLFLLLIPLLSFFFYHFVAL